VVGGPGWSSETSYLEVVDADRTPFSAELQYAEAQSRLLAAHVSLYKAMGGGWVEAASAASAGDD
jgi:multidrug efflux system outer membrane protein